MYLKDRTIQVIKTLNHLFTVLAVSAAAFSVYVIVSLFVYYSDQIETALHAKAMPGSVDMLVVALLYLMFSCILKRLIGDANFYSGYFETDLDGVVGCSDLSEVTGKHVRTVAAELFLFQRTIMKNYSLVKEGNRTNVMLQSKKVSCECKSCGAYIEKSAYFTGQCPYCKGSDLHAKIITDNRFYCISNDNDNNYKKISSYIKHNLTAKSRVYRVLLALSVAIVALLALYLKSCISNYNDEEYLRKVLFSPDNHLMSFDLIRADILDSIVFIVSGILAFLPVIAISGSRLNRISTAFTCSNTFVTSQTPFLNLKDLPTVSRFETPTRKMKSIMASIRCGYLGGCTFEKHDDTLKLALAKKVVKDECPYCGASITGVADERYQCSYCDNVIMDVVKKR